MSRGPAIPSSEDASCVNTSASLDRIIASRPRIAQEDAHRVVYTLLRELPGDERTQRYHFIWSDDETASADIWSDNERLHRYLHRFIYTGLSKKSSDILEVSLIPENGRMPEDADLSQYVFVSVNKLHQMINFSEPSSDVMDAVRAEFMSDTSDSTSTTSSHNSLTSLLFNEDADDEEEEEEAAAEEGPSDVTSPKPLFRFPDLPHRGLHEFNLFLPPVYAVGQLIGQGEFSKVYFAVNLATESLYAVKMFRPRVSHVVNEQIIREVEALKGLQCPNIVKMEETIVFGDNIFVVMELLRKGDLRVYINKHGRLCEAESRKLFTDLLNGVSYIHRRSIVHLDLKLENLVLDDDQNLKIADFGCARLQVGQKLFTNPCGSYAYGAPEVISGNEYDGKRADAWSMGVILFCMIMARLPFNDKQQEVNNMLIERRQVPPIHQSVGASCKDLIARLLTFDREKRASVQEVMSHHWLINT